MIIKSFIATSFITTFFIVNFYSLSIPSINNGNTIHFKNFKNKKILLVNIATQSPSAYQLLQLQQLYNQHKDSFVVIAFPSNSFGNESRNNNQLKRYLRDTLSLTFPIADKSPVRGNNCNIVFDWLRNKIQNDVTSAKTKTDFQKFLIDKNGNLVALFDSSVKPTSTIIQNALKINYPQ